MTDPLAALYPLVTLYCVVHGEVYERYAEQFLEDAHAFFMPGYAEIVVLPGRPADGGSDWSHVSSTRYRVALENLDKLRGQWIFQADVDMRIFDYIGKEILGDGIVVTIHPGCSPDSDPGQWPYERRPESRAYVPHGQGTTYHPGAFVGGRRREFISMANYLATAIDRDMREGVRAVWYEESYLNRYIIDNPPALILDGRYCGWGIEARDHGAIIAHLNKTEEEFATRG